MSNANKNVLLVCLAFFLIFFGFNGALQYLLPFYTLWHKEQMVLTALFILYIVVLIIGLVGTSLIARLGVKKSMVWGTIFYAVFIYSLQTRNSSFIYVTALLNGVGAGLLWIASGQFIKDNSSSKNLGRNLGLHYASFMLGTLCGTALGAILVTNITFQLLYVVFALIILASFPFLLHLEVTSLPLAETPYKPLYLVNKKLLYLFPIVFSSTFILNQTFTSMSVILYEDYGLKTLGLGATVLRLTAVISGTLLGKLADTFDKVKLLLLLGLSGLTGTLLFIGTLHFFVTILGMILIGIYISATYSTVLSLFKEHTPKSKYIYAVGAFHVYGVIAVLISLASSARVSPQLSFLPGLASLIIGLPLLYIFKIKYT